MPDIQIPNIVLVGLQLMLAFGGAFFLAVWVSLVIWTFRDVRSRSRDVFAIVLATLMVVIFGPLGVLLYFLLRPADTLTDIYGRSLEEEALLQDLEERAVCPGCRRKIEMGWLVCPDCHTILKKKCLDCGQLLHLRWDICPYCVAPAEEMVDVEEELAAIPEGVGVPVPLASAEVAPFESVDKPTLPESVEASVFPESIEASAFPESMEATVLPETFEEPAEWQSPDEPYLTPSLDEPPATESVAESLAWQEGDIEIIGLGEPTAAASAAELADSETTAEAGAPEDPDQPAAVEDTEYLDRSAGSDTLVLPPNPEIELPSLDEREEEAED
ncbi:MAG: zinc ribbon domain-containing protein [Ardenticatenia bacterium]|nr:zinc ribbon domain-containing protein [Ardenticatenia bacterium]